MLPSVVFYFLLVLCFAASENVDVHTNLGTIRGNIEQVNYGEVEEYLGIPYAKPPIGNLRFAKPQPLTTNWDDILVADKTPPACSQPTTKIEPAVKSEDCLYLNIWSPRIKSNKKLPVMFWIHGGAFAAGSGNTNGANLSAITETVVVTINYRLHAFGFLFGNSEEIPGNVGLYDQLLALRWVHENIDKFRGDPNHVTIFGQSAGSMSVNTHLLHQTSWQYFKNAIQLSGVQMDYVSADTKENALRKAKALANAVGCPSEDASNSISDEVLHCLRSKDEQVILSTFTNSDITLAGDKLLVNTIPLIAFFPIFGDEFILKAPREMWKERLFKKNCSLLLGTVYNEVQSALPLKSLFPSGVQPITAIRSILQEYTPEELMTAEDREKLIEAHFSDINDKSSRMDEMVVATQLLDNILFHFPTNAFGYTFSGIESNSVYQYVFNYKSKNDNPECDRHYPCHSSELPFTFGEIPSYPDDILPTKHWIKIIGDFAKTGKVFWPKYFPDEDGEIVPVYHEFKGNLDEKNTQIGFRNSLYKIWKDATFKNS